MLDVLEIDAYLKKIFDLENQILDKDHRIAMLQFELDMEKQLMNAFNIIKRK